jgi:hypothetical protein
MMARALLPEPTPLLPPSANSKNSAKIVGTTTTLRPTALGRSSVTNAGTGSMFICGALSVPLPLTMTTIGVPSTAWRALTLRLSCSVVATSLRRG